MALKGFSREWYNLAYFFKRSLWLLWRDVSGKQEWNQAAIWEETYRCMDPSRGRQGLDGAGEENCAALLGCLRGQAQLSALFTDRDTGEEQGARRKAPGALVPQASERGCLLGSWSKQAVTPRRVHGESSTGGGIQSQGQDQVRSHVYIKVFIFLLGCQKGTNST